MNHVLNEIVPIVAILTTFGVPAAVIIVIAVLRYRQKMMLISRGCSPSIDFAVPCSNKPLLWGMVITAVSVVGIAIASVKNNPESATLGILALTVGLALLAYWFVTAPQRRRESELFERKNGASGFFCPAITSGAPLLWGMVISAVSVAGIIISLVRYEYDWTNAAFLTLTAGTALLAYWFVTAPQRKRAISIFEQKCGEAR